MQHGYFEPTFRIWVPGRPQSFQKKGSTERYTQRIREAAAAIVPRPASSPRIDIEIWYAADHLARGDVDNIIKPVLDALNGVVYVDDKQVRSIRAVAIPLNDVVGMTLTRHDVAERLNGEEFLINVFGGHALPRHGP